jgi:hypothetical protein
MKGVSSKLALKVHFPDDLPKHSLIYSTDQDILPTLIAILEAGIEMVHHGKCTIS